MRRSHAAALLLAASLGVACRSSGPAEAYRAFAHAVREGRAQEAWGLLSERSRSELDARAKKLAAETGVVPASGAALLLGDAAVTSPRLASVTVVRESADAAELEVAAVGGTARRIAMVRERGGWRVVLPSDIRPDPP
jgi:hypothetical protein